MASLAGHFLIAAQALRDPNFLRSVVLLVRHDESGALGLIVNAPTDLTVADALGDSLEAAQDHKDPIYRGGPCEGPVMLLHGRADGQEVLPGVHFTANREEIEQTLTMSGGAIRCFLGFAGWTHDQLETELAEGSWVVIPANVQDVFGSTTNLWSRLMSRSNLLKFVNPENIPDEPDLN